MSRKNEKNPGILSCKQIILGWHVCEHRICGVQEWHMESADYCNKRCRGQVRGQSVVLYTAGPFFFADLL